jgi:hypothetical protein
LESDHYVFKLAIWLTIALLSQLGVYIAAPEAADLVITPFYTFNQSPLVQIFGLPAAESAVIQQPGHCWSLLAADVANDFAPDASRRERVILDGESYRLNVALRYGIAENLEIGLDLPWVGYSGGILDGLIGGWHSFFGLYQGKRPETPNDRLLFSYSRDGEERLHLDHASFGLVDLRLGGAWQLYQSDSFPTRAVALRASLKLPTGSSSKLHGSGSTDLALWLSGSDDYLFSFLPGHLTLYGAAGAMALTKGQVLEEQQNHLVGFGTLGLGWSPAQWIAIKTQMSTNSPFYHGSNLKELGKYALQLAFGGTLGLTSQTALDIAVSEDISVDTAPDFSIHLGASHQF